MTLKTTLFCFLSMMCCLSTSIVTAQARTPPKPTYQPGVLFFGQLFTDYQYQWTEAEQFNAFELRRAELGLGYDSEHYRVVINTEAIRSAGAQSLFGIDNNSLVFRVKHAFAQWTPKTTLGIDLTLTGGMIPDVWINQIEQGYDLRGINATLSEGGGFFDSSDLGASLGLSIYHNALSLQMSFTNGEGRNERELNTGKNASFVLSIRPNQFLFKEHQYIDNADLAIHVMYRDGSVGFSSLANHRFGAALTARWERLFIGAEFINATGYGIPNPMTGTTDARGLGGWFNGAIYPAWLGLALMYRHIQPNTDNSDASREFTAGLYADLIDHDPKIRDVLGFPRLRLYLSYKRLSFDGAVSPVPGNADAATVQSIMLTLSARDAKKLLPGGFQ